MAPVAVGFLIFVVGFCIIGVKRLMTKEAPNPNNHNPYNNNSHNENILSAIGVFILGCFLFSTTIPLIFIKRNVLDVYDAKWYFFHAMFYVPSIIMPILYFIRKPKVIRSVCDLF